MTCAVSVRVSKERHDLTDVIYVSCLQICILALGYVMYTGGSFVFKTMRQERYVEINSELLMDPDEMDLMSASPLEEAVVFRNSKRLHLYVFRVHVVGFLLLSATMALDFSHSWCPTVFAIGMALQIALTDMITLFRIPENVFHVLKSLVIWISLFLAAYHTHWPVEIMQRSISSVVIGMTFMLMTGFAWSACIFAIGCEVDMTDISRDAAISCVLVSAPMLFVIHRNMQVQDLLASDLQHTLYLLAIEPILKLLCLGVLVYSLKAGRNFEILIAFCLILLIRVHVLETYTMSLQEQRGSYVMMALLCALHACQSMTTIMSNDGNNGNDGVHGNDRDKMRAGDAESARTYERRQEGYADESRDNTETVPHREENIIATAMSHNSDSRPN